MSEDLDQLENGTELLKLLRANLDDTIATTRRMNDRIALLLSATLTAYGLISNFSANSYGSWQQFIANLSIGALVGTFVAGYFALLPQPINLPGTSDHKKAWDSFVLTSKLNCKKELVKSYCAAVASEMAAGRGMKKRLIWFLICAGTSLAFLAIAELNS